MDKIAVMVCEKISRECTGAGCFDAFAERRDAFARYKGKDIMIGGFFHCNGCDSDFLKDNAYKLESMHSRWNIEIVHMALCIKVECFRYDELKRQLGDSGFKVVEGSHC